MERLPELYVALFGAWKIGAVVGPLFSAFGPDPVRDRLTDSGASVFISTPDLKARIEHILRDLPDLRHLIIVNKNNRFPKTLGKKEISYEGAMLNASAHLPALVSGRENLSIIHYTSGTTGKPKGAVYVHNALIQQYATGKWALDLHEDETYWCTADPRWVTGTSYGMFAPWTNGVSQLIYEGGFRASAWYSLIQKYKVTMWYTAPTAIRMLMKAGEKVAAGYDLSSLRHICSVGEPLNPEAIIWGQKVFKQAIHDNWWQTETGAILIAGVAPREIEFLDKLPKTRSGKIMRGLLKAKEVGLPIGDTSTLEED